MSGKGKDQPEIEFVDQEGRYFTNCMINYTPTEFILDLGTLQPGIDQLKIKPKIRYHTRLRTSPQHAKMILQFLNNQIQKYEKEIGEIPLPSQSSKKPPAVA